MGLGHASMLHLEAELLAADTAGIETGQQAHGQGVQRSHGGYRTTTGEQCGKQSGLPLRL